MRWTRRKDDQLDLTSDSHIENAVRLTQARRRLFNDLIGIREQRGLSQAQVADAIGIHKSGVCKFEANAELSNPTFDVVLRYAHAVGAAVSMRAEMVEDLERRQQRMAEIQAWRRARRNAGEDRELSETMHRTPRLRVVAEAS